jgi:hypothetical protein
MHGQNVACPYCAHPYTGIPEIDSLALTESEPKSLNKPAKRDPLDLVEVEEVEDLVEVEAVDQPKGSSHRAARPDKDSESEEPPQRSSFSWPILGGIVMAVLGVAFLVFCLFYALNKN